jgi:hypothetical protein
MSKKREQPKGGNGAPTPIEGVEPLSPEEFQEIRERFAKRGLPVILYVFQGADSIKASRLLQDIGSRQMAAIATELDEWARTKTRLELAIMQAAGPAVAKGAILVPKK